MFVLKNITTKIVVMAVFLLGLLLFSPTSSVRAQDYGCGAYGMGAYGEQQSASADCDQADLEDTGRPVIYGIVLGSTIIVVGITSFVLTYRHRKAKQ